MEVDLDQEAFSQAADPVTAGAWLNGGSQLVSHIIGPILSKLLGRILKSGSPSAAKVSLRSALSMKPSRF